MVEGAVEAILKFDFGLHTGKLLGWPLQLPRDQKGDMKNPVRHRQCGVAGGIMNEFAQTLRDLAKLCGKSEYQLAQLSGLDPTFVRRLFDGEKRASNLTIIRLTIALVMDPELARKYPAQVPFILNALKDARLSDAIAELI